MAAPNLSPITNRGFGWGYDLSADGRPEMKLAGASVDWSTVVALADPLTLPDSTVLAAGTKVLLPGQVMAAITAGRIITLTVTAGSGTFSIVVNGQTASPAYNANAATIQAAVRALSTVGGANATVTGTGPFTVTFSPDLGDPTITASGATVATTSQGARTRCVGPYDPAAVDGRGATLAGRDDIGLIRRPLVYDPTQPHRLYDSQIGLVIGGRVKKGLIRATTGSASLANGPTWTDLRAALPRLIYVGDRRPAHT